MVRLIAFLGIIAGLIGISSVLPMVRQKSGLQSTQPSSTAPRTFDPNLQKTDAEWKSILTPQQYSIVRAKGTERPFTGKLLHNKVKGTYYSVGCNQPVFRSEQKYDSGTGWPSFWAPIAEDALVLEEDSTLGLTRTEVLDKCGGHLGHVFDDGPPPTGKRYCINSLALYFVPDPQ